MKKILNYMLIATMVTLPVLAEVNMPQSPVKNQQPVNYSSNSSAYYSKNYLNNYKNNNSSHSSNSFTLNQSTSNLNSGVSSVKSQLDSLAMSALKAGEAHDDAKLNEYVYKMFNLGADEIYQPQIIAKQTPHCPPIKVMINGSQKSGSLCAKMGYKYKDKEYDVGYCK